MSQFQTLKSDLTHSRIADTDSASIHDGEIAVKIESFAFTANNVTYGVAGDTIGYWKFFPAAQDEKNEWGCIPMWGFAEITHSNIEGLNIGERLFGYFPAADSLTLSPIKVSDQSFSDGKEHRKELPPVYNNYVRLNGDQNYDPSMDAVRALLFPLHITAFCLCDSLAEDSYFGASQVIVVSASSKTAIGLAQGLADIENAPKIVGLTSRSNSQFVENLGCYDQIGDMGSFFITVGAMTLIGALTQTRHWFYAPSMLLLVAALYRTLSAALYGAPFVMSAIIVEVVVGLFLIFAGPRIATEDRNNEAA